MIRRGRVLVVVASVAAVWSAAALAAAGAANAGAVSAVSGAVPAATSFAEVNSVSCASPGNCAAGGSYFSDHPLGDQGFVTVERHGVWGRAIEVPGLGALNTGGDVEVKSVSCGSAGSCAVGGFYEGRRGQQGFVAVERNGRWGTAIEVPGLGALNKTGYAQVNSVSCGSAGNCAAGGEYGDRHYHNQGFVAVERNGVWGTAIEVPGLGALNKTGLAQVNSVSCGSAGSCAAGGYYLGRGQQGVVAVERNGRWGTAIEVPGLAALNKGGDAKVNSVSCASAGNCAAGGIYRDRHGQQGFVAVERHGRWGRATGVPGLAALNQGGYADVSALSCGSAGSCAAGGSYADADSHDFYGFVAVERDGVWGRAA